MLDSILDCISNADQPRNRVDLLKKFKSEHVCQSKHKLKDCELCFKRDAWWKITSISFGRQIVDQINLVI